MFKDVSKETFKNTLKVGWPAIIESFFTALASIIDSLMVSTMGKEAVAAIGLTSQPLLIRLSIFTATDVAIAALVARRRGEKKPIDANRLMLTALLLTTIMSVIISAAFIIFADPILHLAGSNEDTHELGKAYLRIICAGTFFVVMQNSMNAAQRGAGNTKIAMITHLVSSGVNVCFNYVLINGKFGFPKMGIQGAALATIIGFFVAFVLSAIALTKKDSFLSFRLIFEKKLKPAWMDVKKIFSLNYSIFLENLLLRVGFFLTSRMVAKLGTDYLAAHQHGMNLMNLSFSFGDGLKAAAVALIGRSMGEGKLKKARSYLTTTRILGAFFSAILVIFYLFATRWLYTLWFPGEENVINIGVELSRVFVIVLVFQILQVINFGALHGAGDTHFTAIIAIISSAILRPVLAWLFGVKMDWFFTGLLGIWLGILADQIFRFVTTSIRMKSGKWLEIQI